MQYLKSLTAIFLCLFVLAGCDTDGNMNDGEDMMNGNDNIGMAENDMQNNMQNGMIEGEDNRMMENMTIAQIVMQNDEFSRLEEALMSTGMAQMFESGSYTVLAPTNEAFDDLSDETDINWMAQENMNQLSMVLEYHVIDEEITASDMMDGMEYNSVQGSPLMFEVESDGEIQVSDSEVEYVIHASNGTIFVMDEVLIPEDLQNM